MDFQTHVLEKPLIALSIPTIKHCHIDNVCVYVFISTIVISQPENLTVCKGKGAVISCILNTTNSNISSDHLYWYRLTKDATTAKMINADGESIVFTSNSSGYGNSTLRIKNAMESYTGYYWVGTSSFNVCNVSLTVVTSTLMELSIPSVT